MHRDDQKNSLGGDGGMLAEGRESKKVAGNVLSFMKCRWLWVVNAALAVLAVVQLAALGTITGSTSHCRAECPRGNCEVWCDKFQRAECWCDWLGYPHCECRW